MELSHFDRQGNAIMVDVGDKTVTRREATAEGRIRMSRACYDIIKEGTAKKGDVLGVAQIAGIMACKRTADLIPLCHPLDLTHSQVSFSSHDEDASITATCTVCCSGKTGVEMEALTGASVALLTIYDMCKAIDKNMEISDLRLIEKTGGKSGHYVSARPYDKRDIPL